VKNVTNTTSYELEILQALDNVTDPEMPYISIKELGMVDSVKVIRDLVYIRLLPTFSGCPALDMIKEDVLNKVRDEAKGVNDFLQIKVEFSFDPPWTTDLISETGKSKLKENGITPPPANHKQGEPWMMNCPYCDSEYVTMENIFGPTACRSILYCNACKNPFEAMKPVANINEKVE